MTPAHSGFGRNYGRSLVISQQGIVATSHALASQAGAQILANGGSAVDAAIAANAVLGVVEPMMDGIGGDLFVLYWDAETKQAVGPERIRTRALRPLACFPRGPRRDHHAAGGNSRRHRPRRRRWLGATAQAIRKFAVGSPVRVRHRVCGSRLPGHGSDRRAMDLADFLRTIAEPRRVLASLSAWRKAAERRRTLSQSRPRRRLQQPGRRRIANLLRRRDRRRHSQDVARAWAAR